MTYLLDTNAASALIRHKNLRLAERFAQTFKLHLIGIPVLVAHELYYGAAKSGQLERQRARVDVFLSRFAEPVSFTPTDADIAGSVRAHLAIRGEMIRSYDILIAAQALRTKSTLVTSNTREFARVPDLEWEDWAAP